MNHKKGITLVEVLVVVTILSVLALSVYTVFKSGGDAWTKAEARLEIYQSGRVVLDQISRELVGAFATDSTTKAKLVGTNGTGGGNSDSLTFITDFSDSIYKLQYRLMGSALSGKFSLGRSYIDYSETPSANYYSTPYVADHIIEFVPATIEVAVSNIEFKYLPVLATPTGMADWTASGMDVWPGAQPEYSLPEAIKIILTLKDTNNIDHTLETEVYLPNSEVE